MVVTIFGASGMVGRYLVTIALERGHKVIAFGRNVEPLSALNNADLVIYKGDLFNSDHVNGAVKNSEVVISAIGGDFSGAEKIRSNGIAFITKAMKEHSIKRIIALGGSGILDSTDGQMIMDTDKFDKTYLPVSEEHRKAYLNVKDSGLDYTFFCAPTILNEPPSHSFRTSVRVSPENTINSIKAGDLAEAMIIEAEKGEFIGHRVGITN